MTTWIYLPPHQNGPISWNWITLTGADAQDFLHRLTTVHVRQLAVGTGRPGCFLTAQGKIRSYFHLWNLAPDQYAFEFDAGLSGKWKTDLLATIDQYTFGERITLTDLTASLQCRWLFPDEGDAQILAEGALQPGTLHHIQNSSSVTLCHQQLSPYGRNWFTAWGPAEALDDWINKTFAKSSLQSLSLDQLEKWRIQAIQPRVDAEITESSIPLEIGLRPAIAEHKGCYPGQEVIEKIISLGSPAKRLVRIEGQGTPPPAGEKVQATDPTTGNLGSEIGVVTTTASRNDSSSQDSSYAVLALIRKTHAQKGISIGFTNQSRATIAEIAPYA